MLTTYTFTLGNRNEAKLVHLMQDFHLSKIACYFSDQYLTFALSNVKVVRNVLHPRYINKLRCNQDIYTRAIMSNVSK